MKGSLVARKVVRTGSKLEEKNKTKEWREKGNVQYEKQMKN